VENPIARLIVLLATASLLATLLFPSRCVYAEDPSPSPQLPVLLLNGAVYTQDYNTGILPDAFRVDDYPSRLSSLHLIQCTGPIKETWLEDLRGIGGEPRGYLPYNALLVGLDGDVRSRLGELDFVSWSGPYQPYFKISPALQLRLSQGGEVTTLVELFSPRLLAETLSELEELPVEVIGSESDSWSAIIAIRMPVGNLDEVASLAAVEWMELCTSGTLTGALESEPLAIGETRVDFEAPVDGGESVGLGDTGLGTGGLQGLPHLLEEKVAALISLRGDNGADLDGHGTAVAGSMLGVEDAEKGSNPSARFSLIAFATGYGLGCPPQPLSLYSVLDNAYANGAKTFMFGSVPEGIESLGAYGIYTFQRDAFVWNNPSMALVEAAGNEATDADGNGVVDQGSLLGGATAKNALSVGGCESERTAVAELPASTYSELESLFTGRFPSQPLRDDSSVGTPVGMAAFSSRGPTRDGRIKPDLVAPATDILTLASGGAEAAPGILPAASPEFVRAYGTGMAAAQAAASMASMRLPLAGVQGVEPSAALMKAFLVNGAVDLAPGQYSLEPDEIPEAPNVIEGWGRLDTDAFMRTGSWVKVLDETEGMRLGEYRVFRIEVPSGNELRVTLAWSDYPSLPEARLHLVNDLDLRVTGPEGEVYYPNGRSSRDPLNNVERVVLDISESPGDYSIELSAWNVPFSPQPFALVAQIL
jgi:hypothetical protein